MSIRSVFHSVKSYVTEKAHQWTPSTSSLASTHSQAKQEAVQKGWNPFKKLTQVVADSIKDNKTVQWVEQTIHEKAENISALLQGEAQSHPLTPGLKDVLEGKKVLSRDQAPSPEVGSLQDLLRSKGYALDDRQGKDRGHFGPQTQAAVKKFQASEGLSVDGKVGPKTLSSLLKPPSPEQKKTPTEKMPSLHPEQKGTDKPVAKEGEGSQKIIYGKKVSAEFKQKVIEISKDLKINPNHLMAAMAFETGGTFSPSIVNKMSGATGLIQFMPATAKALKTSTEDLSKMTAEKQLDYVKDYFKFYSEKLNTLEDVYMAILWPRAIGESNNSALFSEGEKTYRQNQGLDLNHDGQVLKSEAAEKVRQKLELGDKYKG